MVGDFVYTEETEEETAGGTDRRKDDPKGSQSPKLEKSLKRFLVLAALIVCGGLLWLFFISPAMVPATFSVAAFPGFDTDAVLHQAGIMRGATYVSVNAAKAQTLLEEYPLVESAKVVKTFPDRISIYLEPRKAVAVSLARINDRMQPVYFDRNGVAFTAGGVYSGEGAGQLPVVSGLFNEVLALPLGSKLPEEVLPLFSRIGEITDKNPTIWQAVSEIGVVWNGNGNYDLVLYPVNSFTKLRMGSDISTEGIYYALLILDVVRGRGDAAPAEIDVRSGIGVLSGEGGNLGGQ